MPVSVTDPDPCLSLQYLLVTVFTSTNCKFSGALPGYEVVPHPEATARDSSTRFELKAIGWTLSVYSMSRLTLIRAMSSVSCHELQLGWTMNFSTAYVSPPLLSFVVPVTTLKYDGD